MHRGRCEHCLLFGSALVVTRSRMATQKPNGSLIINALDAKTLTSFSLLERSRVRVLGASVGSRRQMVAATNKGKRSKVKDGLESLDPVDGELVLAIEKLQEVQDELEKISEEASDKVLEVEQKYSEIRKPIYNKRNAKARNDKVLEVALSLLP